MKTNGCSDNITLAFTAPRHEEISGKVRKIVYSPAATSGGIALGFIIQHSLIGGGVLKKQEAA